MNSLRALLDPTSIAVVGASQRPGPGARVIANLQGAGFPGEIFAVNPRYTDVLGCRCVAGVGDLPQTVDCLVVAVGAEAACGVLEDAQARGDWRRRRPVRRIWRRRSPRKPRRAGARGGGKRHAHLWAELLRGRQRQKRRGNVQRRGSALAHCGLRSRWCRKAAAWEISCSAARLMRDRQARFQSLHLVRQSARHHHHRGLRRVPGRGSERESHRG